MFISRRLVEADFNKKFIAIGRIQAPWELWNENTFKLTFISIIMYIAPLGM